MIFKIKDALKRNFCLYSALNFLHKKAHNILQDRGLVAVDKEIPTLSNIPQLTQGRQVQVSEQQLRNLLAFISASNHKFNELQVLASVVAEKSEDFSTAQTLARIASGMANNFCDLCSEELNDFKQQHPDLVKTFVDDLAA